ncbi:GNAT family N-acetyltransferase [Sphingomonas sp. GCM10030256]|uniref:GNAT family N-acetyltransferase n=1 Tax=Sphingomonas sp. GCM10030256 TaxID=3273427 RepID=UPI003617808D
MSDDADALAEAARNRGLKLKRSRVRTPGKPGFGMFGLVDANDEPVFGIRGKRALRASAEEITAFLRKGEVSDWKASLKEVGARKARATPHPSPSGTAPPRTAEGSLRHVGTVPTVSRSAPDISPKEDKQVAAPRAAELGEAKRTDAEQVSGLFALLEHRVDAKTVARNIAALAKAGEPLLVVAEDKKVLGACGIHRTTVPHRDRPVGRITIIIVAEDARDRGLGRMLLEEAERRLNALGCGIVEVTSNDRLASAHAFYRHMGYERTSMRFAKTLSRG